MSGRKKKKRLPGPARLPVEELPAQESQPTEVRYERAPTPPRHGKTIHPRRRVPAVREGEPVPDGDAAPPDRIEPPPE